MQFSPIAFSYYGYPSDCCYDSSGPDLSVLDLRHNPHRSVKQNHNEQLEGGNKERPSAFSEIMLEEADSGIQQLHRGRQAHPGSASHSSPACRLPPMRTMPEELCAAYNANISVVYVGKDSAGPGIPV